MICLLQKPYGKLPQAEYHIVLRLECKSHHKCYYNGIVDKIPKIRKKIKQSYLLNMPFNAENHVRADIFKIDLKK